MTFTQSLASHAKVAKPLVDSIRVYDTIRITVADTIHTRVIDTLGVVLPAKVSGWTVAASSAAALAAVFAAIASWSAAKATRRGADAANTSAKASEAQATAAREQATAAKTQAEVASSQLRATTEAYRAKDRLNAASLEAMANLIRVPLQQIPDGSPPSHKMLRSYFWLNERTIMRLQDYATEVPGVVNPVLRATLLLEPLLAMIREAQGVSENTGWIPTDAQIKTFISARHDIPAAMRELESLCQNLSQPQ